MTPAQESTIATFTDHLPKPAHTGFVCGTGDIAIHWLPYQYPASWEIQVRVAPDGTATLCDGLASKGPTMDIDERPRQADARATPDSTRRGQP